MEAIRPHLKGKTHIIWDWNGTLLNDIEASLEALGSLLQKHNLPAITQEFYRDNFSFPVVDFYRSLGFQLKEEEFKELADQFISAYSMALEHHSIFPGVDAFLVALKSENIRHSILSAAQEGSILELLKRYEIEHHFDNVFGLSDHMAHGKIQRGRDLIKKLGVPLEEIILIGDTDHDREVAEALGVDALLLADGHQSFSVLSAKHGRVLQNRYGIN